MSTAAPVTAVVLLNWNAADQTVRCAGELLSWQNLRPMVFIVDNASAAQDRAQLAALSPPATLLLQTENLGYAGGNNVGIEAALEAGAEAILLLNNDAHITEAAACRLAQVLMEYPDVAIVGPVLREVQSDGRAVDTAGGRDIALFAHTRRVRQPPAEGRLLDVCYVPGTVAMVRAAAFHQIGLFDPAFFFSGEVADWCARAKAAGWRCVIATDARAEHHKKTPSVALRALHTYYTLRNRFLYVRKQRARLATLLRCYWAALGSASWMMAALKREPEQRRAIRLALSDGWHEHWGSRNDVFLGHSNGCHS